MFSLNYGKFNFLASKNRFIKYLLTGQVTMSSKI